MGIPKYFRCITQQYPEILHKKELNQQTIHNLYLDMNCLIHPMCRKVIEKYQFTKISKKDLEQKMFDEILQYIQQLCNYCKPQELLYLAIDGPAPRAKMIQQRTRRFRSVMLKQKINDIRNELSMKPIITTWDTNAITPGTVFMQKLSEFLNNHYKEFSVKKVIISDSNCPGEGEHKIFNYIKTNYNARFTEVSQEKYDTVHVIYGLDADLIMLSMASQIKNIYLLREAIHFGKVDLNQLLLMDINLFKHYLLQSILSEHPKLITIVNERTFINDYIFLCFLLGNDFLPHLLTLTIDQKNMSFLLNNYVLILQNIKKPLVDLSNYTINLPFLCKIFEALAKNEDYILTKKVENYFSKKIVIRGDSDYEKNIYKINRYPLMLREQQKNNIQYGKPFWRNHYYSKKFNVSYEKKSIQTICNSYFIGLLWTLRYYFDIECPSWEWCYIYNSPPSIKDLVNHFNLDLNKHIFKQTTSFPPLTQLMFVLPPQSGDLLPKKYRKLMNEMFSPILHYYPIECKLEISLKDWFHECPPKLPFINQERLLETLNTVTLQKNELKRNQITKDIIYIL